MRFWMLKANTVYSKKETTSRQMEKIWWVIILGCQGRGRNTKQGNLKNWYLALSKVQCSGYSPTTVLRRQREASLSRQVKYIISSLSPLSYLSYNHPKGRKYTWFTLPQIWREVTRTWAVSLTTVSDGTSGKNSSQFLWVLEEGNTLCVGRAHATSEVRNPPVGGENCREKEQLAVIDPSLGREFPRETCCQENLPLGRITQSQVGT